MTHDWEKILAADSSPEQLLVFADWLSEGGDESTAQGIRWLVAEGKRPFPCSPEPYHPRYWIWGRSLAGPGAPYELPYEVFGRLEGHTQTLHAAIIAAARAWSRVQEQNAERELEALKFRIHHDFGMIKTQPPKFLLSNGF